MLRREPSLTLPSLFLIWIFVFFLPQPPPCTTTPLACDLCRLWRCYLSLMISLKQLLWLRPIIVLYQSTQHYNIAVWIWLSLSLLYLFFSLSHTDCLIFFTIFLSVFLIVYFKNSVFFLLVIRQPNTSSLLIQSNPSSCWMKRRIHKPKATTNARYRYPKKQVGSNIF